MITQSGDGMDKEAAQVLKSIADKLDVPVEQLWHGLVAYAPFTYYQWLVGGIIAGVIFVVALAFAIYLGRKAWDESSEGYGAACAVTSVVAFLCLMYLTIVTVGDMAESLAAKNAPQAWAAKKVMGRFAR